MDYITGTVAIIAAVASLINIFLTVHRNKQDGIVAYRMKWINNMREEFSKVLGWVWYTQNENGKIAFSSLEELRSSVYKIKLLLNTSDDYDNKINVMVTKYFDIISSAYIKMLFSQDLKNDTAQFIYTIQSSEQYQKAENMKKDIQKYVRVYLKTEWMRVRLESSIFKLKYKEFWSCRGGFDFKKATEKYLKEYKD